MNVGGVHMLYKVYPDIVVFGKAMSNGFPMAAIVGRSAVMDIAQDSFISSTYWTERVGPTAAIVTINKIKKHDVPSHLCKIGELIAKGWKEQAKKCGLKISIMGIPPLVTFKFDYGEINQALHTLFTQEMLKRGFLASKSIYVSYSHTEAHVKKYLRNVGEVFGILKKTIENGRVFDLLDGPVAHEGFKRLT
jgi:glutamate-1-semialdehyde aminotransferase